MPASPAPTSRTSPWTTASPVLVTTESKVATSFATTAPGPRVTGLRIATIESTVAPWTFRAPLTTTTEVASPRIVPVPLTTTTASA